MKKINKNILNDYKNHLKKEMKNRGSYGPRIMVDEISKFDKKCWNKLPLRQKKKYYDAYTENAHYGLSLFVAKEKKQEKPEKIKKEKTEATLAEVLKLLNKIFTLNKNVKKNAYETEYSDYCFRCGRHKSEDNYFICSNHNWDCCTYERTTVDYYLRDREYEKKVKYIKTAISLIRDNRLPIKYGKNADVVYFEYCGSQVSFHDTDNKIHCKPFNGKWIGERNKKIPFII